MRWTRSAARSWSEARRAGNKQLAEDLKGARFALWKNPGNHGIAVVTAGSHVYVQEGDRMTYADGGESVRAKRLPSEAEWADLAARQRNADT